MTTSTKLCAAALGLLAACEVPFVIQVDDQAVGGSAAGSGTAGNNGEGGSGGSAGSAPQAGEPSAGGSSAGRGGSEAGAAGEGGEPGAPTMTPCPEGRGLYALSVSAGENHACAVEYNTGRLFCWGEGSNGQLGNGDTVRSSVPVQVQSDEDFKVVGTGVTTTCAQTALGALYCFGSNDDGVLANEDIDPGASTPIISVESVTNFSMSSSYVLATVGGGLFAWGSNTDGQLGLGDAAIGNTQGVETEVGLFDIARTAAGYTHACLIDDTTLFGHCAGNNLDSRLGIPGGGRGSFTQLSQEPLSEISAGYDRTCAITLDGVLLCWGHNDPVTFAGEPAVLTAPNQIGDFEEWYSVSVGFDHVCATMFGNHIVCSGDNSHGELGRVGAASPTFVEPDPLFRSMNVAAGRDFTCAIREPDLAVVCFGSNEHGQLGRGSDAATGEPALVCLPPP